eukprot:SAG31_NODE_38335_length_297_cov_0.631313_1_plen_71_part_01
MNQTGVDVQVEPYQPPVEINWVAATENLLADETSAGNIQAVGQVVASIAAALNMQPTGNASSGDPSALEDA